VGWLLEWHLALDFGTGDEGGTICVVLCDCRAVARFRHCLLRCFLDAEQALERNEVYIQHCVRR